MTIHLGQEEFLIHHRRLKSHGWSISGKPIFVGILSEKIFWLVGMPDPVLGGEDLRLRGPQTECDPHLGGTRRLSQAESICPVAHREGGVHTQSARRQGRECRQEDPEEGYYGGGGGEVSRYTPLDLCRRDKSQEITIT
jgi:hypothetical protein